jgi:polyisoprenoid-binding protein YceI
MTKTEKRRACRISRDATAKKGERLAGGAVRTLLPFLFWPNFWLIVKFLPALLFAVCLPFAKASEYVIDPTHTYASFEIDHLGFSTQRGHFKHSTGIVEFDPESKTGRIDISIEAASLDTGFALRDNVLRGEDWFKAKDYPYIFFRSQKLIFNEEKLSAVEGDLIMLGEMRPMRLEISRFKCGFNLASRKRGCGADAVGVLRRSEFGLSNGLPFIGDEVRLRIQVEAYLP